MWRVQEHKLGMALNRYILEEERRIPSASGSLSIALTAIETAAKIISAYIRRAGLTGILGQAGKTNIQGEAVQKLDDLSDDVMIQHLSGSGQFYAIASEESEEAIFPVEGRESHYVLSMDPLDGSSNIDVNVSIGTIFSIHKRKTSTIKDFFQRGRDQVAAGYVIYGSSTMLVYTTGNGVNGFTLDPTVGSFLLSHPDIRIAQKGSIYSINEGNYSKWDKCIQNYIDHIKNNNYSARYIGSLVSDIHRTLLKGGIFAYPADTTNLSGKLRVLYEVSPISYIMEQAGGKATTGTMNPLDLEPTDIHQRSPFFAGSPENINELLSMF
ncbi:MAG: class 1 fructose-bisphosphatase [Spirochaetota bacterium]|nr:class 1 fructose-bisphosphatase [Spirochaetota bacterium]